jgi:hypothetical protein
MSLRRLDPDDTEGRALYRALAEAVVRMQDAMARHRPRLIGQSMMAMPPDLKDRVTALERCVPDIPAALHQLFALLPRPGEAFSTEERTAFLRAVAALADVVYGVVPMKIEPAPPDRITGEK